MCVTTPWVIELATEILVGLDVVVAVVVVELHCNRTCLATANSLISEVGNKIGINITVSIFLIWNTHNELRTRITLEDSPFCSLHFDCTVVACYGEETQLLVKLDDGAVDSILTAYVTVCEVALLVECQLILKSIVVPLWSPGRTVVAIYNTLPA